MAEKILVVGAGGHCRVVISILRYYKEFEIFSIADRDDANLGEEISGCFIEYTWEDFSKVYHGGTRHAVIAVGDNSERKKLLSRLLDIGFKIPTITHPSALVERDVKIGEASTICMGAKLVSMAAVGNNCIVNTGSIVEHEVIIEDDVFIAPGCILAGRVHIGRESFIGAGSTIIEKVRIGTHAVVGAGSVVLRDVPDGERVGGIPAKRIKG